MGNRYIICVGCPMCGHFMDDVYYAPTCGFTSTKCVGCGHIIDLEEYTAISYDDASNVEDMEKIIEEVTEEWVSPKEIE